MEDKAGFFAERIRDAIAGAGTKDRQLIRVVVSRCEIDMQDIKRAYQQRYGKSVEQAISVRLIFSLYFPILRSGDDFVALSLKLAVTLLSRWRVHCEILQFLNVATDAT